jgi:hypothetical protein
VYAGAGGCGRDYVMAYNNHERKGHYYINYYFENVKYDDKSFIAHFRAPEYDVECDFIFDRDTGDILISNNNKPVEEILPIPVHWLQMKLEENGTLRDFENKISI